MHQVSNGSLHALPQCRKEGIFEIARGRTGWLVIFCIGLLVAAVVVSRVISSQLLMKFSMVFATATMSSSERKQYDTARQPRASCLQHSCNNSSLAVCTMLSSPSCSLDHLQLSEQVEQFEDILEHHVELSFFVPLIMGHGGNTGSQAVTTVIRYSMQHSALSAT